MLLDALDQGNNLGEFDARRAEIWMVAGNEFACHLFCIA